MYKSHIGAPNNFNLKNRLKRICKLFIKKDEYTGSIIINAIIYNIRKAIEDFSNET